MHTVKWFRVLLFNTSNSIQHFLFVCTLLNGCKYCYIIQIILHSFVYTESNGFKYSKWLSSSIWTIGRILTSTTIPDQSGPGSNDNGGILNILQSSRTVVSLSDGLVLYPWHSLEILAIYKIIYSPAKNS